MKMLRLSPIKRHYSTVILLIVTVLLILFVIWLADRMLSHINQDHGALSFLRPGRFLIALVSCIHSFIHPV